MLNQMKKEYTIQLITEDYFFSNSSSTINGLQVSEILLAPLYSEQNKTSTSAHLRLGQHLMMWITLTGQCFEVVSNLWKFGFLTSLCGRYSKATSGANVHGFYFSVFILVFLQRLTFSTTGCKSVEKKIPNLFFWGVGWGREWMKYCTMLWSILLLLFCPQFKQVDVQRKWKDSALS